MLSTRWFPLYATNLGQDCAMLTCFAAECRRSCRAENNVAKGLVAIRDLALVVTDIRGDFPVGFKMRHRATDDFYFLGVDSGEMGKPMAFSEERDNPVRVGPFLTL